MHTVGLVVTYTEESGARRKITGLSATEWHRVCKVKHPLPAVVLRRRRRGCVACGANLAVVSDTLLIEFDKYNTKNLYI
jgi:hypothetical protein